MTAENDHLRWERWSKRINVVKGDDTACKAMTGLSWAVVSCSSILFSSLSQRGCSNCPLKTSFSSPYWNCTRNHSFHSFQVLYMGRSTVQEMFTRWLNVMYAKITSSTVLTGNVTTVPPEMKAKCPFLHQSLTALRFVLNTPGHYWQGKYKEK